MAALWVRAEMRRRRSALLALTIVVALAGATVLTATAGARRTSTAFDRLRESANMTQLNVQINKDLSGELDEDVGAGLTIRQVIDRMRKLPQVEDLSLVGYFDVAPPGRAVGFDFVSIAPLDARTGRDVNRVTVHAGRLPGVHAINEVALSTGVAKDMHLGPGDTISMQSRSADQLARFTLEGDTSVLEEKPDGPPFRMRVVGVVSLADEVGKADLITPFTYLSPAFFERYRKEIGVFAPTIGVRLRHGYADVPAFSRAVRPLVGADEEVIFDDNRTDTDAVQNGLRVQTLALLAFAAVALAAAAVVISQAFSRQLASAADDGPALRALGLTRRERAVGLAWLAAPAVIGGSLFAVLGAVMASSLLPIGLARQAEPHRGLRVDPLVHGAGTAALAVLLAALAAISAWRASRVGEPRAAAPSRPSVGGRLAGRLNSGAVGGTGLRMAFDTRPGVPVRSAMAGAAVAVVALVAVVTFGASLDNLIGHPRLAGFPWHTHLDGGDTIDTVTDSVRAAVADPDAEAVATARVVSDVELDGRHIHAIGVRSEKGNAGLTILTGRAPVGPDEIAIGPETMRRLRVRLGDTIRAAGQDGTVRVRVVGTALFPIIDTPDYNDGGLFTLTGVERVDKSGFFVGLVRYRPGVDVASKRASDELVQPAPVPAAVNNLTGAKGFPQALAAFLALLGLAAVVHVLLLSARRWRRDLAVLRGLGLVKRQAARCITVQAAALGVVATVLGVPLGIAAGRWAWTLTARGLDVVPQPVVPVTVAVLAVVTVAIVVAASVAPSMRAVRADPASVLRAE